MVISISYLPSNAISAYISSQAQSGVASQNATTTQTDPLASAQNTSTAAPTDTSQISSASVITQLSVAGQVKSTLADLQDKAVALKSISKSPNIADFQMIVQGFTQAFNSLSKSIKELASKQNTSADNRSSQALYDVRKAAAGDNSLASMQAAGITPQANGTLAIDRNQLAKSYRDNPSGTVATISNLANRVAQAADKNLSGDAANQQATRRAADAQANSATDAAFFGNAVETHAPVGTTDIQATGNATPAHVDAARNTMIDEQVNAAIDKKVNDVGSAPASQPENTDRPTGSDNVTTQSRSETRLQQPAQPSPPAQSPPPVQAGNPASNTANVAVAAYTSIAAI